MEPFCREWVQPHIRKTCAAVQACQSGRHRGMCLCTGRSLVTAAKGVSAQRRASNTYCVDQQRRRPSSAFPHGTAQIPQPLRARDACAPDRGPGRCRSYPDCVLWPYSATKHSHDAGGAHARGHGTRRWHRAICAGNYNGHIYPTKDALLQEPAQSDAAAHRTWVWPCIRNIRTDAERRSCCTLWQSVEITSLWPGIRMEITPKDGDQGPDA